MGFFNRDQKPVGVVPPRVNGGGRAIDSPAKGMAISGKSYSSPAELPEFDEILTAQGAKFAISESLHASLAAVQIGANSALVLVEVDARTSHDAISLVERLKTAYSAVTVCLTNSSVLLGIYAKVATQHAVRRDRDDGETALSIKLFTETLEKAAARKVTDVHWAIRDEVRTAAILFRIDGVIRFSNRMPSANALDAIGAAYTKLAEESSRSDPAFNRKTMQSCSIPLVLQGRHYKLRFQSIPVNGGLDVICRLLQTSSMNDQKAPSLEALGYSETQCRQLDFAARKTVGVIVVAGVTGSGKSTTLKTLMTLSPTRHLRKSYSIEDPVEYKMFGVSQISVRRRAVGNDDSGFTAAMRVVLRADPDIIMVGEVRDNESCSLMKTAVQSGHQVMTTVHASSAIDIVQRLTSSELGLPRETLGSRNFLSALVYQRLVPQLCPKCKVPMLEAREDQVPSDTLHLLRHKFGLDPATMFVTNENGCEHCEKLGSKGVTVVAEIITPTAELLKLLREGRDVEAEELWRQSRRARFDEPDCTGKTAFEHGLYKAHLGLVDPLVIESSFEPFETYMVEHLKEALDVE